MWVRNQAHVVGMQQITQRQHNTAPTGPYFTFVCVCALLPVFASVLNGAGGKFDSDVMLSQIIM